MGKPTFYLRPVPAAIKAPSFRQSASYNPVMHLQSSLWRTRILLVAAALLFVPALSHAAKDFVMPVPRSAKTYPAHDEHSNEGLTVGLDPYDTEEKAKIFTVNYSQYGILPIFVIVTNDGDQPVALSGMKAEFVTGDRSKLSPSSEDDIYRRLNHPKASATNRYPLPFPSKKVKGAVGEKTMAEIQSAQFGAKAVEPHSSQAGFLFFDVSDISTPLPGSHFYLTGVHDSKGEELMYFEISLEKVSSSP
jgi:hypothetical protein